MAFAPGSGEAQLWKELGGDGVQVVFTSPDSAKAVQLLEWARSQPPLPALPAGLPSVARIILAPNEAAFDSITGGAAPDWSAAVARPARAELIIPAYASERTWFGEEAQTLRHEWAHLGLHEYLEGLRIPRWFDEGYAERAGGRWDAEAAWQLRVAIALGSVQPLDSLELGWPRGRVAARNAYFLSATALEALEGPAGERGMRVFLDAWRDSRNFEGALASVYGHTPSSLERAWREHLKDRYDWLWVLSRVAAGWTVLVVIALLMKGFRKGRRRNEMAELRARDPELPEGLRGLGDEGTPSESPGGQGPLGGGGSPAAGGSSGDEGRPPSP